MERTKLTVNQRSQNLLQVMSRMALAAQMGKQYDGSRDVYTALGYPKDLTWEDYYAQYLRQDIAGAIVDKPIKATWRGDVDIIMPDEEETPIEQGFREIWRSLKLKSAFVRLDKLTSLNTFGVLLLGFSDVKAEDGMINEVKPSSALELVYVKPFGSRSIEIKTYEEDATNPRYGKPLTYQITVQPPGTGGSDKKLLVHYSRVLHVAMDLLEDEVEGTPVLQKVFNRLKDLEKIVGGSAEMYWRGARPGFQGKVDKEYAVGATMMDDLKVQIDEYENDLRRILVNEGVSLEALETQVTDPTNHVDVQIQMISAFTGIPKRILTGSERGELASTQDKDAWLTLIQDRREEFAEPNIVRAFIDKLITLGVLQLAEGEVYSIQWPDLFAVGESAKVTMGKDRATALKEYVSNMSAGAVVTPEIFIRHFLGFTEEQADKIIEAMDASMLDEAGSILDDTTEEEAALEAAGKTGNETQVEQTTETTVKRTK